MTSLKSKIERKLWWILKMDERLKGWDDERYLRLLYRMRIGHPLDLDNPKTFNEKLQWLKLHDRNSLYTTLVDKAEVKPWVAERIGWEHVVPTLGVWDSFDEIDFDSLPERFVLKCTHDSGGLAICRDRASFDVTAARRKIERSLSRNFYWSGREWPYKDVRPRIIAEEYLDPASGEGDLTDYKVMCFGGQARCEFTCTGRADGDLRVDFFDLEWNRMPFTRHYPNADVPPEAPSRLKDMVTMAERLAVGLPFVRADFYEVAGEFYFGELTFYPGSGMEEFDPERWDAELGSWLELPETVGGGWLLMSDETMLWLRVEQTSQVSVKDPEDYKIFCFDGEPKALFVATDRGVGETKFDFFDVDFNHLPLENGHPNAAKPPSKPTSYAQMLDMARTLSAGFPHVRVDFYDIDGKPYFGEMTFYHWSGLTPFEPEEYDELFGSWIKLPNKGC